MHRSAPYTDRVLEWIASLPLFWAILLFWAGAAIRSTTTFALGRGAAVGAKHTRLQRYMEGPVYDRAERFVVRWGAWAIPLCFLTVGLQTAVLVASGVAGMPWRRFIPAMLLGSLIWGVIYGTIGMAVIWAVLAAALGNPWVIAALIPAAVVVAVLLVRRARRRRPARADASGEPAPDTRE